MNEELIQSCKAWADEMSASGWLKPDDLNPIYAIENRSPSSLFDGLSHRPLVVAFFGGTGVGKSTLLNRLAKQDIARTGVERPTSREVSLFLHESMPIKHLPKDFPVSKVRSAYHQDEKMKQVLWIDMPDIDSIEADNRDQVLDWLPHIDVLIYVVNPERYRDDKGFKILCQNNLQHAWLFVFNQWDKGCDEQWQDFERLLKVAGFADPLMFKTICKKDHGRSEDFQTLEESIQSLSNDHVIAQLESRALDAQRQELYAILSGCIEKLGEPKAFDELKDSWITIWRETEKTLKKGMEWPVKEIAKSYTRHEANPLLKSIKLDKPAETVSQPLLWDDWANMQLQDALDRLLLETNAKIPAQPVKTRLKPIGQEAQRLITQQTQIALRQSLANPGNALQRSFLKFAGFCAITLPLAAMGWVCYRAVTAYYFIALNHADYLGTEFAMHSALLIAISWLLPFFIQQKLKPSTERAALRGLQSGVESGLAAIEAQVLTALDQIKQDAQQRIDAGQKILSKPDDAQSPIKDNKLLRRMLSA